MSSVSQSHELSSNNITNKSDKIVFRVSWILWYSCFWPLSSVSTVTLSLSKTHIWAACGDISLESQPVEIMKSKKRWSFGSEEGSEQSKPVKPVRFLRAIASRWTFCGNSKENLCLSCFHSLWLRFWPRPPKRHRYWFSDLIWRTSLESPIHQKDQR